MGIWHPRLVTLALASGLALAAGCSSPSAPATGPEPSGGPAAPKVNRLVMSIDPVGTESNEIRVLAGGGFLPLRPIYEHLISLDPEGRYTPGLATEWTLEPSGTAFRFKLRRGVQFHHGHGEFTARDLEEPWRQRIREDFVTSLAAYWRTTLDRIEVVNDFEAVYHLKRPDGNYLLTMSEQRGSMEVFSKKHFDEMGPPTWQTMPLAGTAPYQFMARAQGEYVRYQAVPFKHWRTNAEFPEFEFRYAREASTRLAALIAGEVHLTTLPEDLIATATKQGAKVIKGKAAGLRTFLAMYCCYLKDPKDPSQGYQNPDSPLADVRVRTALSKGIQRDQLNQAFFAGKGERAVLAHHHPTRLGWNAEWDRSFDREYGYDPEGARRLLAEAGYGPGKPLVTNIFAEAAAGFSGAQEIAEALATQWRTIGVQANLVTMDAAELNAQLRALRLSNHLLIDGTGSDQYTGAINGGSILGVRGRGIELPEVDRLLGDMGNTLDEKRQDELWRRAGDLMFAQRQSIPLFWLPTQAVAKADIVADWAFPGSITGSWTHIHNIKAAR